MLNGLYFETQVLGAGAGGQAVHDLPRKGKSGKKTIAHERIDEQINNFYAVAQRHKITFEKNGPDVQVYKQYHYELREKTSFLHPEIKIILTATYDLIAPIEFNGVFFEKAVQDVKLPLDRNGGFGEFNWGNVQYMDHTQLVMYSTLTGLPSFYLVFDYNAKDMGHRIIPVLTLEYLNALPQEPENIQGLIHKGKQRKEDLHYAIERTAEEIIKYDALGWEINPGRSRCHNCPVSQKNGGYCTKFEEEEEV